MIPDFNNVYGHVVVPHGLEAVLRAVRPLAARGRAWIKVSGHDGAPTLHPETDSLDFRTTPLGGGRHLFNGGVGGTAGEVVALVEDLSRALWRPGSNMPSRSTTKARTCNDSYPLCRGPRPHDHSGVSPAAVPPPLRSAR